MTKECKMSPEDKARYKELMSQQWDLMPDNLHDMLHALWTQKKSVFTAFKEWAEANNQTELATLIQMKLDKVDCKIKKFE